MDSLIKRISKFINHKNLTVRSFEVSIGASNGVFRKAIEGNKDISSKWIENLFSIYPDLNPSWLITGEGNMIIGVTSKGNNRGNLGNENNSETLQKYVTPQYSVVNEEAPTYGTNKIPLVFANAVGGWGNTDFAIGEADIKDFYVIPKFKDRKIDFMIEVSGSSMYPKYNSGDVVACRKIGESSFIQWNKVHVIATKEQGILIKRLKKHTEEDNLLAVSDNKDYEPFCIPKSEITGLAIVVGVIRLE